MVDATVRDGQPAASRPSAVGLFKAPTDGSAEPDGRSKLKQKASFFVFCDRYGYEVAGTFEDGNGDTSAADPYDDMLRFLRLNRGIAAVVLPDLEVLGPAHEDLALSLLEINGLGAKVHLVDGQLIDPFTVVNGFRPQPLTPPQDMSERIKSAMRSRAIKGEGLGKPPFGYHIGPSKKLELVPEEAQTVRLIYRLYTQEDQGMRKIVRHLNERGITTRRGGNWSMVTIRDILRNRVYLGTYTRFGLRVPGNHAAIITPDMFRWAQATLEKRRPSRNAVRSEPFLLSGLAQCASCGNRMVGMTRRQKWTRRKDGSVAEREYRYYQCQSRTNQGVCGYQTRKSDDLEREVLQRIEAEGQHLASSAGQRPASQASYQREIRRLESAREKLETRLKRSIKRVSDGKLSLVRFRPVSAEVLQSRRELLDREDLLRQRLDSGEDGAIPGRLAPQSVQTLVAQWDALEFERKRRLLQDIVEGIVVGDAGVKVLLRPGLGDG